MIMRSTIRWARQTAAQGDTTFCFRCATVNLLPGAGKAFRAFGENQTIACADFPSVSGLVRPFDFRVTSVQLGQGKYGTTYLGRKKSTGQRVAIKCLVPINIRKVDAL